MDATQTHSTSREGHEDCPMSPLLFALAFEPLADMIRRHKEINGVELVGVDHRIVLYADDILLFVKNAESSVPIILYIINVFSKISGYKIILRNLKLYP